MNSRLVVDDGRNRWPLRNPQSMLWRHTGHDDIAQDGPSPEDRAPGGRSQPITQPNRRMRCSRGGGGTMAIVHDGDTLVLSGDFDVRSTMQVRSAIHDRLDGFEHDLVVDLSAVETMDATAARVLAYATLEASRSGHHLL